MNKNLRTLLAAGLAVLGSASISFAGNAYLKSSDADGTTSLTGSTNWIDN